MQVVSIGDTVSIGVNGEIRGGSGAEYGGDALILMDATAASSVNLSGSLIGGNASLRGGEPGQSLLVVGDSVSHARVVNCLLQDGENTFSYDTVITPCRKSRRPSRRSILCSRRRLSSRPNRRRNTRTLRSRRRNRALHPFPQRRMKPVRQNNGI